MKKKFDITQDCVSLTGEHGEQQKKNEYEKKKVLKDVHSAILIFFL